MREVKMLHPGRSVARAWTRAALVVAFTLVLTASFTSTSWAQIQYKTLHRFTSGDRGGNFPAAGLVADLQGKLYGTTNGGGANYAGAVFELAPNRHGGWTETVLHLFKHSGDGDAPAGDLVFDAAGNLYGTTFAGGNGSGIVFELTPDGHGGWHETVLYAFQGNGDGAQPVAGLIFDSAGNLYGTTNLGGTYDDGTVFEMIPDGHGGWNETVLHSFNPNRVDGIDPEAGLIFDSAGNLYGTTASGGTYNNGTVFEFSPNGHGGGNETVLHSFNRRDGGYPFGGLIFDPAGNLYGTTINGGAFHDHGTVFKLAPDGHGGWKETVLHSFNGTDGATPRASLIFDSAGNLYGTTQKGGAHGCGAVFELVPNGHGGWKETVLHSFKDRPGAFPLGSLIFGSPGHLYGTTSGDSTTTFGSVFEIAP